VSALPAILLAVQAAFTAEPATAVVGRDTLHGTVLAPSGGAPVPVVFLHPGSGPTDRDGNSPVLSGRNNSLRLLAEGLAERGIATLRVDKRGIGASAPAMKAESDLRFETYVEDAAAWLRSLRADRRFDRVIAAGHSEGALIAALAAERTGADGYVSIAGPGRRASSLLRTQLAARLSGSLAAENEHILSSLERGKQVRSVPDALMVLYRPSVQPYLISWFRYDPAAEVARLKVPVLIAQGTTDLQVDSSEATKLASANRHATQLRVEGMNHVLKLVSGPMAQQLPSSGDSTLPVAPELIEGIARFARMPP
jgi:pimeloyl-ACP methyl ester carboxylesterase